MTTGVRFEGNLDFLMRGSTDLKGGGIEEKKMAFTNRYTTMIPLRRE